MQIGFDVSLISQAIQEGFPKPSLDLDLYNTSVLDSRITFTRPDLATCATSFGSDGRLVVWGRNELLWSEDFSNAAWGTPTHFSVSAVPAPNGSNTGSRITSVSAAAAMLQAVTVNGTSCTATIYFKAGTSTPSFMVRNQTTATPLVSTGFISGAGSGAGWTSVADANGWFKLTMTATTGITSGNTIAFYVGATGAVPVGQYWDIWHPQLELGSTATAYSPTTTAANSAPRFDYDPATANGTTGPELVSNGDFSSGLTGWAVSGGSAPYNVTASGGVLNFAGSAAFVNVTNVATLAAGKTYAVSFQIASSNGQAVRMNLGGSFGASRVTVGTYTENIVCGAGANVLLQDTSGLFVGTIDSISVKEIAYSPRGLLIEESRENKLLHSRDMTQAAWSKTDVTPARTQIGLDGVANTACLMTEGVAGTATLSQVSGVVTAGATISMSFVLKRGNTDWVCFTLSETSYTTGLLGWFNLNTGAKGASVVSFGTGSAGTADIKSLGGGWYRCTVSGIPSAAYTVPRVVLFSVIADGSTTRVNNATYIVDCAGLEVGAFATSIIITDASTKTRAADSASMTGSNFSSWWNATQGTLLVEGSRITALTYSAQASVDDGTSANEIYVISNNPGYGGTTAQGNVTAATVSNGANSTVGGVAVGTVAKMAIAYISGNLGFAAQGVTASAIAGNIPTGINRMSIGSRSGIMLNGHIRRIAYYPTRLPNATLQALTA